MNKLREDPDADSDALSFPEFIMRVGEGKTYSDEGKIGLPRSINIVGTEMSDDTTNFLSDRVFRRIETKYKDTMCLASDAIPTVQNS